MRHIDLEPASWVVGSRAVPASSVETVLALSDTAGVEYGELGVITYVESCLVNGRRVPHFAIEGETGPVMLLLLADEPIAQPLTIETEGHRGVILPLGRGSVAVVGVAGEPLEPIIARVGDSVSWRGWL